MGKALKVVIRIISSYLIKRADQSHKTVKKGAVTLIQCFGSSTPPYCLFSYVISSGVTITRRKCLIFRRIKAPTGEELTDLVQQISVRISNVRIQWLNRT